MDKAPCWCGNILSRAHTDILHSSMLEMSSGLWSGNFYQLWEGKPTQVFFTAFFTLDVSGKSRQWRAGRAFQPPTKKKLLEIYRIGRGNLGLWTFSGISVKKVQRPNILLLTAHIVCCIALIQWSLNGCLCLWRDLWAKYHSRSYRTVPQEHLKVWKIKV